MAVSRRSLLAAAPALAQNTVQPSPVYDSAFWKIWGDGQAELAGYDLTFPRYNVPRMGTAVTIFVTESFSNSLRVKADPGKHPPSDQFPAMKLNLIVDFQTGIYDYNEQTSTFIALAPVNSRPAGTPTKISFSSQEWCGHTWYQFLFDADRIRTTLHSYFDGEADQQLSLPYPAGGVAEDQLWLWARSLAAPRLAPGESRQVPFLPSLQSLRHQHAAAAWTTATLERSAKPAPVGTREAEVFTARFQNGWRTFYVERTAPHRILRWETSGGERAELLDSARLKYWELNKPGGEQFLKKLGLNLRGRRTT